VERLRALVATGGLAVAVEPKAKFWFLVEPAKPVRDLPVEMLWPQTLTPTISHPLVAVVQVPPVKTVWIQPRQATVATALFLRLRAFLLLALPAAVVELIGVVPQALPQWAVEATAAALTKLLPKMLSQILVVVVVVFLTVEFPVPVAPVL
jgi:hypothetical protein